MRKHNGQKNCIKNISEPKQTKTVLHNLTNLKINKN